MINYEYTIKDIFAIDKPNEPNFILQVNYIMKGTNENGTEAELERWLNYSQDSSGDFIPFENLTKSDIINWIKEDLGEQGVKDLEFQIKELIETAEANKQLLPTKKVNIPE